MTEQNEPSTPPSSQRAPERLTTEQQNHLICEKLLGWLKKEHFWLLPPGENRLLTPRFASWADAGLILEALSERECKSAVGDKSISGGWWCTVGPICELRDNGPAAVRAAALEYIRSLP